MSRRPQPPRRPGSSSGARPTARPGRPAAPSGRGTRTRQAPRARREAETPSAEPTPARMARLMSVRALVLGVVVLTGFTLLLPTVRAYLGQRADLDALAVRLDEAETREDELAAELERWDDDAYVAAQARERLGYVLPGETAYRVVDPDVVPEDAVPEGAEPGSVDGPTLPVGSDVNPWYATVWESVVVAGEAEPAPTADDDAAEGGEG